MTLATVDGVLDVYTLAEVAERLRVSRYLLHRLIQTGDLVTIKLGSRRLVTRAALEAFVTKRQTEGR